VFPIRVRRVQVCEKETNNFFDICNEKKKKEIEGIKEGIWKKEEEEEELRRQKTLEVRDGRIKVGSL